MPHPYTLHCDVQELRRQQHHETQSSERQTLLNIPVFQHTTLPFVVFVFALCPFSLLGATYSSLWLKVPQVK